MWKKSQGVWIFSECSVGLKAKTKIRHSGRINSTTPLFYPSLCLVKSTKHIACAVTCPTAWSSKLMFPTFSNHKTTIDLEPQSYRKSQRKQELPPLFQHHLNFNILTSSNHDVAVHGSEFMLTHPTCRETPMPSSSLSCHETVYNSVIQYTLLFVVVLCYLAKMFAR